MTAVETTSSKVLRMERMIGSPYGIVRESALGSLARRP
jgi:hypothetical protein